MREAVFNILAHGIADFALEGARVLDLFAGTGALGLEALSRGAAFCLFVEEDADARALIRRNVEALGLTGVTKIFRRDATDLGRRPATAAASASPSSIRPTGRASPSARSPRRRPAAGWRPAPSPSSRSARAPPSPCRPASPPSIARSWGDTEALLRPLHRRRRPGAAAMTEREIAGPTHYPVSGWVEAFLYMVAIAVLSVSYVVGQQVGAHPIAFILYAMLISAVALLAVTGFGADALDIMLAPQSWLVGLGMIGIEIAYYILLDYVSPAHGSLLVRLAIPMSVVAGWLMFARRPPRLAAWGTAVVFLGIAPLLFTIDAEHRLAGAAARIAAGAFSTLRSFAAEFHPWNRRAATVMDKLRVTGLVVLVTSAGEPGAGGRGCGADRHRPRAAVRDDADRRADAARTHRAPRHRGRLCHPDRHGGAELLGRGQDHHRERDGGARLHAGVDAAGADGRHRRRPDPVYAFDPACCRPWAW